MNPEPKVTLLSHTKDPLETVYAVWQASKGESPLMSTEDVKHDVPRGEVEELFRAVIAQRIPIGEHVDFVFVIENVSVSWREQAVRHRIGTGMSPERVGVDIVMDRIPDLADSSWWSQSMRIQDMSLFAERGAFRLPATVVAAGAEAVRDYRRTMVQIARTYSRLIDMGVPMEDARELIPLGAHHRISWRLNIGSLQHIVGKRGCWILQLGIWGPVIAGMIEELAAKVHPIFRELVTPPCLKGDSFTGCVYMEENRRRYTQDDRHAPCPLHVSHHHLPDKRSVAEHGHKSFDSSPVAPRPSDNIPMYKEMLERAEDYRAFWGRDPYTGKRLPAEG